MTTKSIAAILLIALISANVPHRADHDDQKKVRLEDIDFSGLNGIDMNDIKGLIAQLKNLKKSPSVMNKLQKDIKADMDEDKRDVKADKKQDDESREDKKRDVMKNVSSFLIKKGKADNNDKPVEKKADVKQVEEPKKIE